MSPDPAFGSIPDPVYLLRPYVPVCADITTTMTEKSYTILYIEDDPSGRRLVERVLQPLGYQVLTADRAFVGLDAARRHQPDLILTDINLPDLSGPEVVALLRREE